MVPENEGREGRPGTAQIPRFATVACTRSSKNKVPGSMLTMQAPAKLSW